MTRPATSPRCRIEYVADGARPPRFDRARARAVVEAALAAAKGQRPPAAGWLLTVLLVDAARSAELHGAHFADPSPTDVMTFPDGSVDPASGRLRLGDLAVCVDVARTEAARRGRPVADELTLYILHGLLHLLGHDDRDDGSRRRMWRVQRRLLATVGIGLEAEPD